LDDWVQNCLQLSAYFINLNAFALAQYCLSAVDALLAKHSIYIQSGKKQQEQQPESKATGKAAITTGGAATKGKRVEEGDMAASAAADTAAGAASRDDQQQQQQQSSPVDEKADAPSPAAAVHDRGQQQDQGPSSSSSSSKEGTRGKEEGHEALSADIVANVHLARAKLNLYRLVASMNTMAGQKLDMKYSDPVCLPETLR
jgi:hypothetical protein